MAAAALVAVLLPQAQAERSEPRSTRTSTAMATLTELRQDRIPGTAWATDPRTGQMVVTADTTVTGDTWDTLETTVRTLGEDVARLQRSPGELRLFAEGGDAIFAGSGRCSLGFNVTTEDGTPGFLTAGHCGVIAAQWSDQQDGDPIATVQEAVFPGEGDFALLTYDDPATAPESVVDIGDNRFVPIDRAADAEIGQQVFRMGSTTGLFDGQVTGLEATVNYPEGTVTGLIQTTVCAEPGDSGGSLFTEDGAAVGLTSGGSGNCDSGGVTFFQPVTTALAAVNAQL
ncbi:S1 family peptidase [Actinophytocola xanthii]|uniref:S1 family peptidase n=1 Tax=Actinophytocola xanthii TaxID=1912961 RepID=UPI000AF8755C|nr:S1 family peptidase [Actinophytocola xanthii]